MGYRLYLGEISKKEHDEMQVMSYPYLCKKYGEVYEGGMTVSCYELVKEIFELGKYYDAPENTKIHFFADKEMQAHFEEHDFWIVDKKFLEMMIEQERKTVMEWYLEQSKEESIEKLRTHMENMATEWGSNPWIKQPYILDLDTPKLVSSWKREYQIFDLVRLYKTFDFEKNNLVYYGW